MSILFTIGRQQEPPSIINDLLNTTLYPAKPHYPLASEHALVLHDCYFEKLNFTHQPSALFRLWTELRMGWGAAAVKLARLHNHLEYVGELEVSRKELEGWADAELNQGRFTQQQQQQQKQQREQRQQQQQQQQGGEGKKRRKKQEDEEGREEGEDMSVDGSGSGKGSDDDNSSSRSKGEGRREEEEEEEEMIKWRDALAYLSSRGIVPDLEESKKRKGIWTPYIPLSDRPLGKSYDEAVAEMGAKKRELYEQAQRKRGAAEKKGGMDDFFFRMRGVSTVGSSSSNSSSSNLQQLEMPALNGVGVGVEGTKKEGGRVRELGGLPN